MLEKRFSNNLKDRIKKLYDDIEKYAVNKPVEIVVVSKKQSIERVEILYHEGFKHFAENIAQEVRDKDRFYSNDDIKLSFIGNIQSNKLKYLFKNVDLIQSIDTFERAKIVNEFYRSKNKKIDVLLEIKVSDEETKHGFLPSEIYSLKENFSNFDFLNIKGVMCIAPNTDNENFVEESFRKGKEIFLKLKEYFSGFEILSMGMSDDYKIALKNGSNMLRLGRYFYEGF
ncbi:MAG: Proline synthetase associated protein [candidate division TA06 bacterium 32_111]|uniref:Pyridoxal phosphate homeostasis protein n=1 Tax=candidate division TA06 bacterium 34_109 TaxID=1635277 RepID=A0A117M5U0_UNCT6|nr:MAG: Proline synthetase associated protein [candidate division TA06 bacterium 32_111]KUK85989.1 MAG: Proline synthetase associated protein [candidate division TA06 bacterium 34_109]HCP16510.1 YggS family pyridoxal phosphate-dependent enzyme [candidate division WOR-3 bacterium]